jgi:hypothetical protein
MFRVFAPVCAVALLCVTPLPAAEQQPSAKRIAALIEKLGDDSFEAREEARKQLEKIGEPAWDALAKARQTHDDLEVRRQARRLLAGMLQPRLGRLIDELGEPKKRDAAAKQLKSMLEADDERAEQQASKAALAAAMRQHKQADVRKAATDLLRRAYAERMKRVIEQMSDEAFAQERDPFFELTIRRLEELRRRSGR